MKDDNTTAMSPDPQESKRGYADPSEQAKRAPESTGQVNAQGQREGVGENIAKHKQEIAQDQPAKGQDTAERMARNASRDVETADVNVQKMRMLFGDIGKEQQKPSPERAARMEEMKTEIGKPKETIKERAAKLEKQLDPVKTERTVEPKAQEKAPKQTIISQSQSTTQSKSTAQTAPAAKAMVQQAAPKEKSASQSQSTTQSKPITQSQSTTKPSRIAKIGAGLKKVGTKIAALASRKKGGAGKTTGDTGQKDTSQQKGQESKGAPQQGQGEKKGIGERLKKAGKTAMKGLMVAALLVINPILALLAVILLKVTGKKGEKGGPTNQQLQQQESRGQSTGKQVQQSQAITAPAVESQKGVASPTQAPPLADKPITAGIAGGTAKTTQPNPLKAEEGKQITVPANAGQGIKDKASALTQAMGQGKVGERAATKEPNKLPEQQKTTIGVSKFASEGIKAQAAALIQKSGGQFGKPSNVQGASAQTTGVAQAAAAGKSR